MYGAILGDIIGSPYEFDHNNIKSTEFPLFSEKSHATDDTLMTLAVAKGIINGIKEYNSPKDLRVFNNKKINADVKQSLITSMQEIGRKYPNASYGLRFEDWLNIENPLPYESFGNGSAMRVSFVAWNFESLYEVEYFAGVSAEISHNHSEGIKGAKSVAAAIFLGRIGASKEYIRNYIENIYGYDLSRSCDELRLNNKHIETCQETVPLAFAAFFEGANFEEVVRLAVSLGGDSDTIAAIAGSIAESIYSVPEQYKEVMLTFFDDYQKEIFFMLLSRLEKNKIKKIEKIKKLISALPYYDNPPENSEEQIKNQEYLNVDDNEISLLYSIGNDAALLDYDYFNTQKRLNIDFVKLKSKIEQASELELRLVLTFLFRASYHHGNNSIIHEHLKDKTVGRMIRRYKEIYNIS